MDGTDIRANDSRDDSEPMRKKAIALLIVLLVLTAVSVRADERQPGENDAFELGDLKAEVGAWAEYLHYSADADPVSMRLALVGREAGSYWHEIRTVTDGVRIVVKLLVRGDPPDLEAVRRIIFKSGKNPALEMPAGSLGMVGGLMLLGPSLGLGQAGELPELKEFKEMGREVVSVGAGRLTARRYRLERTGSRYDVWIAESVPLWGLVKIVFPGGRLELLKYGQGAQSDITEQPQKLEIPLFLQPDTGP